MQVDGTFRGEPGPRRVEREKVVLRSSFPGCPVLTSAEYSTTLARDDATTQGETAIGRKKTGESWSAFVASASSRRRDFENLVANALDGLPAHFAAALSNVEIVVEDEPEEPGLLGLYQGVPLTERDGGYAGVLPDRITIYRGTIEREARSPADLERIVKDTVLHELAHHFGIDDDRLRELGRD